MIIEYQALNNSGALVNDSLVVEQANEAYAELTRRGLTPVRIKETAQGVAGSSSLLKALLRRLNSSGSGDPKKASKRELPLFTTQMAILLETGTPVAASLDALARQLSSPNWRMLVTDLGRGVEEGATLASAVGAYPEVFDPVYSSMIAAGEASGNLSRILSRLADLSRQADRMRNKLISAMIYPALLTIIALTVMSVLIFFVLPRFAGIFEEMNVDLPGSTKALMAISDFARQRTFLMLIGIGGMVTILVSYLRSQHGRRFVARNSLRLPIAGALIASLINARVFRLLSLLVESSVPLIEALELTIKSTKHYLYAELITKVHDNVLNGRSMHETFAQSDLIPASITQMVRTGEENGEIGKVTSMLADYLDDKNETKISMLTSIMEPVILIFMGLVIGTIAISLVLPMFDLSRISG